MTLIDTAEIYGNGKSEELVGRAIASQRDHVFLVSKVWPTHAERNGIVRACEASLSRLRTDYLDLYLLHWPSWPPGGLIDLSVVVPAFESLRAARKIRAWGVSNFDVSQMEKLFQISHGDRCATNRSFITSAAAALSMTNVIAIPKSGSAASGVQAITARKRECCRALTESHAAGA